MVQAFDKGGVDAVAALIDEPEYDDDDDDFPHEDEYWMTSLYLKYICCIDY